MTGTAMRLDGQKHDVPFHPLDLIYIQVGSDVFEHNGRGCFNVRVD